MELNRRAQEESIRYREQLIKELEEAKELTRQQKEQEEKLKTARRQELEAQVLCAPQKHSQLLKVPNLCLVSLKPPCFLCAQLTEQRLQKQEEQQRQREEEEEERSAQQHCQELVQQEAKHMAEQGYRPRVGSRAVGQP